MARTVFSGPIKAGTNRYPQYQNVGTTMLFQDAVLNVTSGLTSSQTIYIPAGCQILEIIVDTTVAFNAGSATTVTVGNLSTAAQYAGGVSAQTTGRVYPTFTAAQLANLQSTTSDVYGPTNIASSAIVCTATSVGTQPTTGQVYVSILYLQNDTNAVTSN